MSKRYHKRQFEGLCGRCGIRPMTEGHRTCSSCRTIMREQRRQRRLGWREAGLCDNCGAELDNIWARCNKCMEKMNNRKAPYRQHAKPCELCGFEHADVHHIDGDHNNNDLNNLISLCPNHHRLVHYGLLSLDNIPRSTGKCRY